MENQSPTPKNSNKIYNNIILKILQNIGFIGSILMAVAYIAIVLVLILGFKTHEWKACVIFALVNTVVGLLIMQFLKIQGISFAKIIPENKVIIEQYYKTKTKDKKIRSIRFFWFTSVTKDVIFKGITFVASTIGIIYLCIEGSKDLTLLLFALVNLIMFTCFGFLALTKAYDFYNNRHIQFMIEKIKEAGGKISCKKNNSQEE